MIRRDEIDEIGKFLKTHALKGELNAQLDIDAGFLHPGMPLIVERDGIFVPFFIESMRPKGHFASLIKLDGVDSGDDARDFVNQVIYARKSDVEEYLEEEEVQNDGLYLDDMEGYTVIDASTGVEVGRVMDIDCTTANVLFIVVGPEGEIFVPASPELIVSADMDSHTVHVMIPDGLIDLNLKNNKFK